jgi:hypothetical protein
LEIGGRRVLQLREYIIKNYTLKLTYFIAAIILVTSCINSDENKVLQDGNRINVFIPSNDEISNQDAQD